MYPLPRLLDLKTRYLNSTINRRTSLSHHRTTRGGGPDMSNYRNCFGVNGEALQLHAVYKKRYSQARICIRYYKSHCCVWTCNEIEGLYDKIIITIVTSYARENLTRLFPLKLLLMVCSHNKTDGNQIIIFPVYYSLLLRWHLYNTIKLISSLRYTFLFFRWLCTCTYSKI